MRGSAERRKGGSILGWLTAFALPLLAASSAQAQTLVYPVYGLDRQRRPAVVPRIACPLKPSHGGGSGRGGGRMEESPPPVRKSTTTSDPGSTRTVRL